MAEQRGDPPARRARAEAGEIFVQKDLARTMRRMVEAEAAARASGREAGPAGRA